MRKLISLIVLVGVTILMLIPVQPLQPVQRVQAVPGYEEYFTVREMCTFGPDQRGQLSGEWVRDCNGNMTGWGAEPGVNCTYTDVTFGSACPGSLDPLDPLEPSYP